MNPHYKEYSEFLGQFFDFKVQKLPIDTGGSCPNRNGMLGFGGCIYCRNDAFSPDYEKRTLSIQRQIERGKTFFSKKYASMKYLAYFQSYTPTNISPDVFLSLCEDATSCTDIVGIIIGTRPDCISTELLESLSQFKKVKNLEIFFEIGAESANNETLEVINRCHTWEQTAEAVRRIARYGFPVGLHLILGLPGEDTQKMVETIRRVNSLPISTIKFHQLQVLKGTILERQIARGKLKVHVYTPEEYAVLCAILVKELRSDIAIERFVSQSPQSLIVSPKWGLKKDSFDKMLKSAMSKLST